MANSIGSAYLTLVPKMESGWKGKVDKEFHPATESMGKTAGSKAGEGFNLSFGSALKGLAGLAIVKQSADAVVGAFTSSFNNYAQFEQLEGGVKKLFGEDIASTVMNNANAAFETAGMSANQYMDTVTSFSASLISGLGGDTAAAAEIADVAIRDMSDNANTFGTNMESIQNAYQGFAKGNYTMLDNLKLGYGGTQSEMVRLINESGVLGKEIKDLDGVTFDQMIAAIHEVQVQTNIAGTTAAEAAGTIEGSINMAKAQWENFLTALANPEADWGAEFDGLLTALGSVIENAWPIVTGILGRIPQLLSMAGDALLYNSPMIGQKISELVIQLGGWIAANAPTILLAAVQLFGGLLTALVMAGANLFSALGGAIGEACGYVASAAGEMLAAGIQFMQGLSDGIHEGIDNVISTVTGAIGSVIDTVTGLLGIHSPSRVMAQFGKYTMQGFADGIDGNASVAEKAMQNAMGGVIDSASVNASVNATVAARNAQSGAISNLGNSMSGMGIYLDGRTLVGGIAPQMNRKLGRMMV